MRKVLSHDGEDMYLIYPTQPIAATAVTRSKRSFSRGPVYEPKILFDGYSIAGKSAFTALMDNIYPNDLWDASAIMDFLRIYQENFLDVMTDILKGYDSRVMLGSGHPSGMGEEPIITLNRIYPNKTSEERYQATPVEMCAFPWRDENGLEFLQVPALKGKNPALMLEKYSEYHPWVLFRPNTILCVEGSHLIMNLLNEEYGRTVWPPDEIFADCHTPEILNILKHGKVNYFNSLSNSQTKINGPQQADWLN